MASYEVDGQGNVKVHTFKVWDQYEDDGVRERRFTDYAAGCDWARQVQSEIEAYSTTHDEQVEWDSDYEWIPRDEVSDYMAEMNDREN